MANLFFNIAKIYSNVFLVLNSQADLPDKPEAPVTKHTIISISQVDLLIVLKMFSALLKRYDLSKLSS